MSPVARTTAGPSRGELHLGTDSMLSGPEATLSPPIPHPRCTSGLIRCLPGRGSHSSTAITSPPMSPVAPPRDRASSILFTRVGLRKNSKATYSPLGLRKNFMLQCTGFTLGSLQFSERVLWESFNTSYFEASPRPKVPGGSYTSGLIRCLAARKPLIDRHYLTPDVLRD